MTTFDFQEKRTLHVMTIYKKNFSALCPLLKTKHIQVLMKIVTKCSRFQMYDFKPYT